MKNRPLSSDAGRKDTVQPLLSHTRKDPCESVEVYMGNGLRMSGCMAVTQRGDTLYSFF